MASPTYTKVQCEPAHRGATRDFMKLIEEVARDEGWRESDAFARWLNMATAAMSNPVLKLHMAHEEWDKNEELYMAEVKRMRRPEISAAKMAKLMGITIEALEASPADFLSPIFMELSAYSGHGQFFTPWALCQVMAQFTLQDIDRLLNEAEAEGRSYITAHEPTCGAGATVLAANQYLRDRGFDPARRIHWQCVDVDWRCVCACYVQLNLTGASALVVHGDTLRLESHRVLPTIAATLHPKTLKPRPTAKAMDPPSERIATDVRWPTQQADLFGEQA